MREAGLQVNWHRIVLSCLHAFFLKIFFQPLPLFSFNNKQVINMPPFFSFARKFYFRNISQLLPVNLGIFYPHFIALVKHLEFFNKDCCLYCVKPAVVWL